MSITLEKVDLVRERTGVSYQEAKEALEKTDGDVVDAIVMLEQTDSKKFNDNFQSYGNDVILKLKELIKKGNVTRILLQKDDKTILDIPVMAGAVGALLFTPATIVAIIAALATGCELQIVKEDGEIINIKDVTEDGINKVKEKVDEFKTKKSDDDETEEVEEEVEVEFEEDDKE